jgi:lysylphosphatidylglycerol synthetase-like protein (DUF2156 family)
MRVLERWPPAAWLAVAIASLLILMGGRGRWDLLAAGMALALIVAIVAVYLAIGRRPARPRPRWFSWALGGVAAFYVVCAVVASLADPLYAIAALAAGLIPLTAVALLLATLRSKTVEQDGTIKDTSVDDHEDPRPGIGLDPGSVRR